MMRLHNTRVMLGSALVLVLAHLSAARLGAQASKGIHVCLGTDNALRYTSSERCPQGQRMFRLAEVEDEVGVTKDREDPPNEAVADLKSKIDFLTRRVANLEGELRKLDTESKTDSKTASKTDPKLPTQVRAPFEVVDKSGKPIFVVADVPHALVPRRGRIEIAQIVGDNQFSMLVNNTAGKSVAGIGEMIEGGGMYVADAAGKTRVFGSANNGLQVYNKAEGVVAHIKSSDGNNGQFWLYDASGLPMVRAGTEGTVGVVGTGPNIKCTPSAGLRAPDCLVGRR